MKRRSYPVSLADSDAFRANLSRLLEAKGYTQAAFARLSGVHRTYLHYLLKSDDQTCNPVLGVLIRFAHALEVPLSDLLASIPSEPKHEEDHV